MTSPNASLTVSAPANPTASPNKSPVAMMRGAAGAQLQ
jgi:hypothetical protein